MDKMLEQLQAPKRHETVKRASYNKIQTTIHQRRKRQKRRYTSVLAAAVILFVFLTASFFPNRQPVMENTAAGLLTIEKGYAVANNSTVDLTYMMNWYYFDKNKVEKADLTMIQPFVTRLYEEGVPIEELPNAPTEQLLVEMSNGSVGQLAVIPYDDEYVLVEMNTKQSLPLTLEEARDIDIMISDTAERSLLGPGQLVILVFLIALYIAAILEISPGKKEKLEQRYRTRLFLAGIGMYLIYIFVNGLSLYYFQAYNGLFIASVMAMLLLLKRLVNYYNGRFEGSLYEVPLLFIFMLLFTFVKCL